MANESNLAQFLKDLAADPEKIAAYLADREAALAGSGLSEDHQALLRANDLHGIHVALLKEQTGDEVICIFGLC
jgi:hypothetical protein